MVAALATAHRVGVVHGRVAPDCVVQVREAEDPWAVQVAWAGAEDAAEEDGGDPRCWAPEVAAAVHAAKSASSSKRASDSSTAAAVSARAIATSPAADMGPLAHPWLATARAHAARRDPVVVAMMAAVNVGQVLRGQLATAEVVASAEPRKSVAAADAKSVRSVAKSARSTTSAFPPPVTDPTTTPPAWAHISPYARDWLARVLAVPPGARISAQDALAHPWLATARAHAARRDPVVVAMMAAVNVGQVLRGQLATAEVVASAEPRKSVAAADAKSVRSVAKSARSVRSVPATARGGRRRRLAFPRVVPSATRGRAGTGASVASVARDEWEDVDDDNNDELAIESDSDSDSAWSDASSTRATGAASSSSRRSAKRGTSVASSHASSSARRRRVGRVRRAPPRVPRPPAPVPVQQTVPSDAARSRQRRR
ncbi:hypothetical protein AMAG_20638 [Allomyces macrogynus ATCC 38327]|uniref:Protein kinase domain-containing protein n=1 Tax=Allomyces macrogynus (strain ATCC 38327) TaxID=578462 RepID=A0A0L0TE27_ALLM3|nr:hypothetical protein AMAG_20638 [Allomyces macrogynus ATCC 38327]|eukprot:KNE72930.1 hypothetical protein AMAG_20638 [Allomyces macrogynus ATCC 38327]